MAAHAAVLAAILTARAQAPEAPDLRLMNVTLIELPPPADVPAPPSPAEETPQEEPPPRKASFRPTPAPPPEVEPMPAGHDAVTMAGVEMSDSDLAGATNAGTGYGGGGCNMPKRLQTALRKDGRVRAAMSAAHRGKAIRVWSGDWVRHPGQEGAGLAAVREAIMWEVGFAPEACRKEPVSGLVVISLDDSPGAARIVLGAGAWRWTDLLYSRSTPKGELLAMR
ncbi:MAG: hypothetical protein ACK4YQ_09410 [Phenylobacterium sp.]|uniref:hypothetical protein n=1 Tax=Phenylobacterium sp. TaxID=1871053 RepID=UPI00391AB5FF